MLFCLNIQLFFYVFKVLYSLLHVFISTVDVILGNIELLTLCCYQTCDFLLNIQHILHLVFNIQELFRFFFNQLTL
jgi:hypothetical protein